MPFIPTIPVLDEARGADQAQQSHSGKAVVSRTIAGWLLVLFVPVILGVAGLPVGRWLGANLYRLLH